MDREFEKMPLYNKGMEILDLVEHIVQLIPEENEMLKSTGQFMMSDAMKIPVKIAGAHGVDIYDLKMENATIIRKSARDIYVSCNHFLIEESNDADYLEMLRATIEEFRILFAEWVKTFDQRNYIIDRWGLFNPPGVNYDDKDSGDIPFENPFGDDPG